MEESDLTKKINKTVDEVKTFPVQFSLDAIKENISISTKTPSNLSKEEIINKAFKSHSQGSISEAAKYYQQIINQACNDHRVFSNYGSILKSLGKLKEAELLHRKAIELKPDFANAHYNLGNVLIDLGKLDEAEISTRKAIELNPDFGEAHSNLGSILIDLGKLDEAEISTRKAIELKPDYAMAYSNLGIILKDFGKLKEAEISTRKAIELNPDFGEAHNILGNILRDLGNLEEAELFSLKAIELNPDLAMGYQNLSLLLYAKGHIKSAVKNIEKAFSLAPTKKNNQLLLYILRDKERKEYIKISNPIEIEINRKETWSEPIILKRAVDPALIKSLYKIKSIDLNKFKDPSFGKAKGSNYKLFENNEKITDKIEKDLTSITKKVVNSNVFFRDSFFTILSGKSTIAKHNHIGPIDKFVSLNLWKQKYALVYYLSVGDQNCKHPGILKLYPDKNNNNPNKEILPSEGMIVIFPADRYHSVKYDGNKDRIIIGVNFYSI